MAKVIVLNPFTIDPDEHSEKFGLLCEDPSLTVQADVQAADINFIVKQFGLTGELPYGRQVPIYEDFSGIPNDYHAAMQMVQASDEAFMTLSAEVRARFDNDPGKFLSFIDNNENYEEAERLGVVPRRPVPAKPAEPPIDKPSDSADA